MRLARLACVLFALIMAASVGPSSQARADVVGRVLASAYHQPGGPSPKSGATAQPGPTAAPVQSADLAQWAGEARATTLPELLQIAVRDSPSLQNAKIDIAVAEARIQQTWARNDWLIGAQLKANRVNGVPANG